MFRSVTHRLRPLHKLHSNNVKLQKVDRCNKYYVILVIENKANDKTSHDILFWCGGYAAFRILSHVYNYVVHFPRRINMKQGLPFIDNIMTKNNLRPNFSLSRALRRARENRGFFYYYEPIGLYLSPESCH